MQFRFTCMVGPALAGSTFTSMKKNGKNVPITHEIITIKKRLRRSFFSRRRAHPHPHMPASTSVNYGQHDQANT